MANNKCKECGCLCKKCTSYDHDVHLHVEIENLKQKLVERENHIVTMETTFLNEANKFPSGELVALREELLTWQDKYRRLYDAHRRIQRVNQGLEDKLLKLVDTSETDKSILTKDVATLSQKLAEANYTIKKLTEDNERYKNDVSLAVQFLQCNKNNFVVHKFDSLPQEVQSQVSSLVGNKRKPEEKKVVYEMKNIKVPIPTFPPTAMVYSVPKSPKMDRRHQEAAAEPEPPQVDIVSAAIMAKVLEERQKDRAFTKHCDTCTCSHKLKIIYENTHHSIGTQTADMKTSCTKCNELQAQSLQSMRLVARNPADNAIKKIPIYPADESLLDLAPPVNNIVKVQPNNFLLDKKSCVVAAEHVIANNNPNNNHLLGNEVKTDSLISFSTIDDQEESSSMNPKKSPKLEHHHLCDNKASRNYDTTRLEAVESDETTSAKNSSSENLKGPRYCSMRLQTGTRNILLDNAHNNLAPVLYTRHPKSKNGEEESPKKKAATESCSSEDFKNNSLMSDTSTQHKQRVADWIKNNLDNNEISSSDNSQSEAVRNINDNLSGSDKSKYAEMEENVKRFLFGESEFMKTVEIGKLRYQNYRDKDVSDQSENKSNACNSHTETEI